MTSSRPLVLLHPTPSKLARGGAQSIVASSAVLERPKVFVRGCCHPRRDPRRVRISLTLDTWPHGFEGHPQPVTFARQLHCLEVMVGKGGETQSKGSGTGARCRRGIPRGPRASPSNPEALQAPKKGRQACLGPESGAQFLGSQLHILHLPSSAKCLLLQRICSEVAV